MILLFIFFFFSWGEVFGASYSENITSLLKNKDYESKLFLKISGWQRKVERTRSGKLISLKNKYLNKNVNGKFPEGIDSSSSLKSYYKKHIELYLRDKDYACRKPAYTVYFNSKLGLAKECDNKKMYFSFHRNRHQLVSLDLERVYALHYFFASEGENIMSRWGHAMLRVVVCAPHRIVKSEDCMDDISHHVTVNYRANVNDHKIDNIKGIIGDYESLVYFSSVSEVVSEYNDVELRDLISLPLKFTDDEIRIVLQKIFDSYWSYGGRYKFFSNNCASELNDVLSIPLLARGDRELSSLTPLGLYDELVSRQIGDEELVHTDEGRYRGYRFVSKKNWYVKSDNFLKSISNYSVEVLTKDKTPAQRKVIFEQLALEFPEKEALIRSHFLILEQKANDYLMLRINQTLQDIPFRDDLPIEIQSVAESLKMERIRDLGWKGAWTLVDRKGYGNLLKEELSFFKKPVHDTLFTYNDLLSESDNTLVKNIEKQHKENMKLFMSF